MLDYKEVKERSFAKEVATNKIVSENVLHHLEDSKTYLVILSSYARKAKWQKINIFLILLNAVVAVTLPYIAGFFADKEAGILLISSLFWLGALTSILFTTILLLSLNLEVSKPKIKSLAIEQEPALKDFFLRFVDKQVLPSVAHDFLAKNLKSNLSEFFVITKSDDSKVGCRNLVLAGLYGVGDEKVEVGIVLKFNRNYSKLELNNYYINQHIATSRFGGSDNGS